MTSRKYATRGRQSNPQGVAIYTRFSSELQSITSTEDQKRECRDAAERLGWTVLDQYIRSDEDALYGVVEKH
jgi:hypothetical protein